MVRAGFGEHITVKLRKGAVRNSDKNGSGFSTFDVGFKVHS